MVANPARLSPACRWIFSQKTTTPPTAIEIAQQDGARVSLAFQFVSLVGLGTAGSWWINPLSPPVEGQGFLVDNANPYLQLSYADFGPLIGQPWYAAFFTMAPPAAVALNVFELSFDPALIGV